MAELLVQIVDKTHEDVFANQTHCKRGDVVVVCPDGWKWGREELRDERTMVVIVPGLSMREGEAMVNAEQGDRMLSPMLHARGFGLDLEKLKLEKRLGWWKSQRRVTVTVEEFRAAKVRKTAVGNPFIVGA